MKNIFALFSCFLLAGCLSAEVETDVSLDRSFYLPSNYIINSVNLVEIKQCSEFGVNELVDQVTDVNGSAASGVNLKPQVSNIRDIVYTNNDASKIVYFDLYLSSDDPAHKVSLDLLPDHSPITNDPMIFTVPVDLKQFGEFLSLKNNKICIYLMMINEGAPTLLNTSLVFHLKGEAKISLSKE